MAGRVEGYRAELRALQDWEPYLKKHSGLPGARANLELVEAVGGEAGARPLWSLSSPNDRITTALAASRERKDDGFRALRKALGYCWSVAAAAAPENAVPYFEKWMRSRDKDVAWVMKSNLAKARMAALRKELVRAN